MLFFRETVYSTVRPSVLYLDFGTQSRVHTLGWLPSRQSWPQGPAQPNPQLGGVGSGVRTQTLALAGCGRGGRCRRSECSGVPEGLGPQLIKYLLVQNK